MDAYRVAAHDEEARVSGVQGGKQIEEVGVHASPVPPARRAPC
jgi:hypothetical protein